jgi:predicted metal-binding membrane protein
VNVHDDLESIEGAVDHAIETSGLGPGMGQTDTMGMAAAGPAASMTLPLFLGIWVTMMVAMMFPSVAPLVVIYSRFRRYGTKAKAPPQSL